MSKRDELLEGILGFLGKGKKQAPKKAATSGDNLPVRYVEKAAEVNKKRNRWPWIVGGLAGAGGLASGYRSGAFGNDSVADDEQDLSWATLFPGRQPTSQAALLKEFYDRPGSQIPNLPRPDYTAEAEAINAAQAADLERYLTEIGGYTDEQSAALQRMYSQLAGRSQLLGQAEETEAMQAGAGLENLYRNMIGAQAADTGDMGELAGLAGPAGEMATGADVTGTQARTLVDYLGREGAGARASAEELAIQQQQQGLGSAADLATMARLSSAAARRNLGETQAARLAEARLQEQAAAREDALMRMQLQREREERIFAAEIADRQEQMTQQETARAIQAQVGNILRTDPSKADVLIRDFGSTRLFLEALERRPELAYYYGLIAG